MPAVTNPNPDRARRGGNAAATTAMVARAAAAGEEEEPTAASPAAIVAQPAPAAATRTVYGQIRSTHRSRMHHGTVMERPTSWCTCMRRCTSRRSCTTRVGSPTLSGTRATPTARPATTRSISGRAAASAKKTKGPGALHVAQCKLERQDDILLRFVCRG